LFEINFEQIASEDLLEAYIPEILSKICSELNAP